jgi:hypothetical protein
MADLLSIKEHGKIAQGKSEYISYLEQGKKLPPAKAIKANCYQCMNSYADGKNDCEIPDCPLYPFMPYRKDAVKEKRTRSERQIEHDRKLSILRSSVKKTMSDSR